jgi:hypothetical protein
VGDDPAAGLDAALTACAELTEPVQCLQRLCREAVEVLAVTGAAVTLVSREPTLDTGLQAVWATDATIQRLADLQHTVGQGPSIDAAASGQRVHEPDLAANGPNRWPWLTESARAAGFAALFSFPLQLDGAPVATLDAYRDRAGGLPSTALAAARVLTATILCELIQLPATTSPAALGGLCGELSRERAVVEQGAGVVSAQLAISVDEATGRLRAHARHHRRSTVAVARDVIDHSLRLD